MDIGAYSTPAGASQAPELTKISYRQGVDGADDLASARLTLTRSSGGSDGDADISAMGGALDDDHALAPGCREDP
jgi:hypothetical protein